MNGKKSFMLVIGAVIVLVGIIAGVSMANRNSSNGNASNNNSVSQPKEYTGKVVCLPKKGDGPHTLECAIGLQTDDGKYYVVKESDASRAPGRISTYATDSRVVVTGTLSAPSDGQYDAAGVITITDIRSE